ncbi:transcriptional regulator GcvA [Tistrella bauzanensis]|uniref:transcriptional regulator GcvA n=1 Tax=Tistrella TaxID=171436 RepID=UPI0031F70062
MSRKLPPLNGLRAFEAAARYSSFARAAEELNVTPAAVSHQIKGLEAHLGVTLFRRLPNGLLLTAAGHAYLPGLTEGFDRIARSTTELRGRGLAGRLTVSVLSSFAGLWLAPRLARFRDAYPDIELFLSSETRIVDFAREAVDLAIRYVPEVLPPLVGERLLDETLSPVLSPVLLERAGPVADAAALLAMPLIHDADVTGADVSNSWRRFFEVAKVVMPADLEQGLLINDTGVAVAAAVAGQGVVLGRSVLVADHLAAGRLVRPLSVQMTAAQAYHVVTTEAGRTDPRIAAFIDWLREEAMIGLVSRRD